MIDVIGAVAMFMLERHSAGSQVRTIGQALFSDRRKPLTVSSQIPNPVTPAGRVVDVLLEVVLAARGGGRLGRPDRELLPEQHR